MPDAAAFADGRRSGLGGGASSPVGPSSSGVVSEVSTGVGSGSSLDERSGSGSGASAGGFGAGFNFPRFAEAFPESQITLLDDSAPIMADDYVAPCLQSQWRETWNFADTLPSCPTCTQADGGGLTHLTTYIAERHANANFCLISSTRDATISIFYAFGVDQCSGFGTMTGDLFQAGLYELRDSRLKPSGRWGTYFIADNDHVWTQNNQFYNTEVAGTPLTLWLEDLLAGEIQHISP